MNMSDLVLILSMLYSAATLGNQANGCIQTGQLDCYYFEETCHWQSNEWKRSREEAAYYFDTHENVSGRLVSQVVCFRQRPHCFKFDFEFSHQPDTQAKLEVILHRGHGSSVRVWSLATKEKGVYSASIPMWKFIDDEAFRIEIKATRPKFPMAAAGSSIRLFKMRHERSSCPLCPIDASPSSSVVVAATTSLPPPTITTTAAWASTRTTRKRLLTHSVGVSPTSKKSPASTKVSSFTTAPPKVVPTRTPTTTTTTTVRTTRAMRTTRRRYPHPPSLAASTKKMTVAPSVQRPTTTALPSSVVDGNGDLPGDQDSSRTVAGTLVGVLLAAMVIAVVMWVRWKRVWIFAERGVKKSSASSYARHRYDDDIGHYACPSDCAVGPPKPPRTALGATVLYTSPNMGTGSHSEDSNQHCPLDCSANMPTLSTCQADHSMMPDTYKLGNSSSSSINNVDTRHGLHSVSVTSSLCDVYSGVGDMQTFDHIDDEAKKWITSASVKPQPFCGDGNERWRGVQQRPARRESCDKVVQCSDGPGPIEQPRHRDVVGVDLSPRNGRHEDSGDEADTRKDLNHGARSLAAEDERIYHEPKLNPDPRFCHELSQGENFYHEPAGDVRLYQEPLLGESSRSRNGHLRTELRREDSGYGCLDFKDQNTRDELRGETDLGEGKVYDLLHPQGEEDDVYSQASLKRTPKVVIDAVYSHLK